MYLFYVLVSEILSINKAINVIQDFFLFKVWLVSPGFFLFDTEHSFFPLSAGENRIRIAIFFEKKGVIKKGQLVLE